MTSSTPPPPPWTYTVSVRSLCEFTAKHGDLDRRFTPSATAMDGLAGQAAVVARRGADYETEVALEGCHRTLRVRGRADGYDPVRATLEEIKTIRGHPDDLPDNRRQLHWAQLQTYGALFCRTRGVVELKLALVYVDVATQAQTMLEQHATAPDLEAAFQRRCEAFAAWSQQEAAHRAARNAGLSTLPFPLGEFRPGQRQLAASVYRAAARGQCLQAQAPTGIGKTLGTLYPTLRAMPAHGLDKIAYLTCKGTARIPALHALQRLRDATPGRALRVMTLVAKEQACEHPDKACHGDACPLAQGFYDRLPAARAEAVQEGWLDADAQRRVAMRHGVCPYYLGHELLRWADVVVGDVHHAFDPHGQLFGLSQALDWRLALLVDEAHNLVERARQMHSTSMSLDVVAKAMQVAPAALRPAFKRLSKALLATVPDAKPAREAAAPPNHLALEAIPDALTDALQGLTTALGEHMQNHPTATGVLLTFYFEALRLQRLIESFGTHSIADVEQGCKDESSHAQDDGYQASLGADEPLFTPCLTLSIRNVVPAVFLRPRLAALHSVTLFSATLGPQAYVHDMLGLPDGTARVDVPPPFAPEHLSVRVARHVSTRWTHRRASLGAVVDVVATQFAAQPGNYLAFFSSFAYLEQAADRLASAAPDVPQWRQSRQMDEASRRVFLQRFAPDGRGIGFAVLGGAFAEGIDLPGTRLIGAFIATLGLPPVSPVQTQMRERLDTLFPPDHGYADRVPGLQRVVQAAGRVIRTPDDRGWLWLMDDRFRRPEIRALLPDWWRIDGETPPPSVNSSLPLSQPPMPTVSGALS